MLAIPPPPKVLMAPTNRYKPFLYCRNNDHLLCYDRAKESWYAHSMDEIVIWTVERHYGEFIHMLQCPRQDRVNAVLSGYCIVGYP